MTEQEKIESKILISMIKHADMEGNYLEEISAKIIEKKENELFSFENLYSKQFPISKDLFENWIQINKEQLSFLSLKESCNVQTFTSNEFDSLINIDENRWSVFYSLSRPGISDNNKYALIQITAYCPAGPPNYGSLYLLKNIDSIWNIEFSYGIYNQ